MATFRSVLALCFTALVIGFFTLEWLKNYKRYEFLVKGDVCIAFDHQEDALKVIGIKGCVTIPLTKTMEQQMRERIENELTKKVKKGLLQAEASEQGQDEDD
ncbi:MAG: hypothetical protein LBJ89_04925 [Holosporales bacterium]|jgi:hypothetical protein|nr:hypothetical protein [Holosporales bacterium]